MCESPISIVPLDIKPNELISPHFFYKFYPSISKAAEHLDKEIQKGVSRVSIASIKWDGHTELYRKIKKLYDNNYDAYFDDLEKPYLTYGYDSTKVRRYDTLYIYLKENCDFEDMNRLVEYHDAVKSRLNMLENVQMSSLAYKDGVQFVQQMQVLIRKIVQKFFDNNINNSMKINEYDVEKDVVHCRAYLHITGRRMTTLAQMDV